MAATLTLLLQQSGKRVSGWWRLAGTVGGSRGLKLLAVACSSHTGFVRVSLCLSPPHLSLSLPPFLSPSFPPRLSCLNFQESLAC